MSSTAPASKAHSAAPTPTRRTSAKSETDSGPISSPQPTSPAKPLRTTRRSPRKPLLIVALVGALGVAVGWWLTHRGLEWTDDAQLDGEVVGVSTRTSGTVTAIHFTDNQPVEAGALLVELDAAEAIAKLARAEAELLAAKASAEAAEATAELTEKNATAGKDIAKASLTGAAFAVQTTATQIAEAKAALASAMAFRDEASRELERTRPLVASGAMPTAQLDSANTTFDRAKAAVAEAEARIATLKRSTSQARARVSEASARLGQASETVSAQVAQALAAASAAKARVATAKAIRDLARLDLSYTKIFAPKAGVVSKRGVNLGQVVSNGQTIVMLAPDSRRGGDVWVTGNFKETQLGHLRVGQPATLSIDAYGRELRGHVESFSGATGSRFALLPPDNASGNFTKVVQRVPVRIALDEVPEDMMLLPGLSVELTVDTRL